MLSSRWSFSPAWQIAVSLGPDASTAAAADMQGVLDVSNPRFSFSKYCKRDKKRPNRECVCVFRTMTSPHDNRVLSPNCSFFFFYFIFYTSSSTSRLWMPHLDAYYDMQSRLAVPLNGTAPREHLQSTHFRKKPCIVSLCRSTAVTHIETKGTPSVNIPCSQDHLPLYYLL